MHECKHGCGYKSNHRGAMNLHEKIHCKSLRTPPAKEKKPSGQRYCDCDGEGDWAYLDKGDPAQARAIADGYKKVCKSCGEVV